MPDGKRWYEAAPGEPDICCCCGLGDIEPLADQPCGHRYCSVCWGRGHHEDHAEKCEEAQRRQRALSEG